MARTGRAFPAHSPRPARQGLATGSPPSAATGGAGAAGLAALLIAAVALGGGGSGGSAVPNLGAATGGAGAAGRATATIAVPATGGAGGAEARTPTVVVAGTSGAGGAATAPPTLVAGFAGTLTGTAGGGGVATSGPAYPLAVSANGRSLVDQAGVPFLLVGDSPQSLAVNCSTTDYATYFADRAAKGFNSASIDLVAGSYTYAHLDRQTYDGIAAFTGTVAGWPDLTTPNPTYWARMDQLFQIAAQYGICIWANPFEWNQDTSGSGHFILEANGATNCQSYGAWLGARYASQPNIVWAWGNDYNGTTDASLVQAMITGVKSADTHHLHTIELFDPGDSLSYAPGWGPYIEANWGYAYSAIYQVVLAAYNNSSYTMPAFLGEAHYDGETLSGDTGTPYVLREQAWWTMTSGGCGQLYGDIASTRTTTYASTWLSSIDTQGATEIGYWANFFTSRQWQHLVPDQGHTFWTSGYGTSSGGAPSSDPYGTAALTADGTFGVCYTPVATTLTIAMSEMAGSTTARWYDPSAGTYTAIGTYPNSGTQNFTTPGNNADGSPDWVLVLEAASGTTGGAGGAGSLAPRIGAVATSGGGGGGGRTPTIVPPAPAAGAGGAGQATATIVPVAARAGAAGAGGASAIVSPPVQQAGGGASGTGGPALAGAGGGGSGGSGSAAVLLLAAPAGGSGGAGAASPILSAGATGAGGGGGLALTGNLILAAAGGGGNVAPTLLLATVAGSGGGGAVATAISVSGTGGAGGGGTATGAAGMAVLGGGGAGGIATWTTQALTLGAGGGAGRVTPTLAPAGATTGGGGGGRETPTLAAGATGAGGGGGSASPSIVTTAGGAGGSGRGAPLLGGQARGSGGGAGTVLPTLAAGATGAGCGTGVATGTLSAGGGGPVVPPAAVAVTVTPGAPPPTITLTVIPT